MIRIARTAVAASIAAVVGLAALAPATAATATKKPMATKSKARPAAKAAAVAAPAALSATQLDTASRVNTGESECEFSQKVTVEPMAGHNGWFNVGYKGKTYQMAPEDTTTGAVRLEDKRNGVMWLQIANKSMLMNSKAGQRMVDNCMHPAQRG